MNITAGFACGSNVVTSGQQRLRSIVVTSQGRYGVASATANRFQYRPRKGFNGIDEFSVELRGIDQWGNSVTNTLNVTVNVQ